MEVVFHVLTLANPGADEDYVAKHEYNGLSVPVCK